MAKKLIAQDCLVALLLVVVSLIGGLLINKIRTTPLPSVYSPPKSRLNQAVGELGYPSISLSELGPDVDRDETQKASVDHAALILDARPEIFYNVGHIPSAISLPRDDFEVHYRALQATLTSARDRHLIVYCSGGDCQDSEMVADALRKLGYAHVHVFRGGWSDWEAAQLPEEKNND